MLCWTSGKLLQGRIAELLIIRWTEDCGHLHRYMCTCSTSILRWSERVKTSSYKYLDPRFLRCTSPMYEASVFNTVVLETSTAHFIAPSINCIQEKNICTTNSNWTPQRAKYFTLAKTPKERYSRHTQNSCWINWYYGFQYFKRCSGYD